jgi:hypothetical protein
MWTMLLNRHGFPGLVGFTVAADGTRWNKTGITGALDRLASVPEITIDKNQMLELLLDRPGIGPHPFDTPGYGDYADPELAAAWAQ